MIENKDFNEYVELFKKLPLQNKKEKVNEEIKKLIAFVEKAKTDLKIDSQMLYNREILDLNSDNISDEDFVEAMFVYIYVLQESMGKYFNTVAKILYK